MSQPTERTRLLVETNLPEYIFNSGSSRERKRRVKQFQCCLCASFLSLFVVMIVISVAYSINEGFPDNSTTPSNISNVTNETPLLILLSHKFPLPDHANASKETMNYELWKEVIDVGKKDLIEKDLIEKNVLSLPMESPSYRHQRVTATTDEGRSLSLHGFVEEYATKYIHRNRTAIDLVNIDCPTNKTILGDYCYKEIECNLLQKYRNLNGTCNNINNPSNFGVAYTPFRRLLPPNYADGISKPRESISGSNLPSARTVSLIVHKSYSQDDPKFTVMLAVWGQFLDHDITATALSQKSNGSTISCCDSTLTSSECFPVFLDAQDPFVEFNVTCMEFVRSAPAPTCCLGPREQMNQVTSFIDASVVYGVDEILSKKLRSLQKGSMKVYVTPDGRSLLPISDDLSDGCNRIEEGNNGRYCFLAGDARANENLHLVTMHLIWVRQHNKISTLLYGLNPHWDDERIYQETKRIVGAQMQHITYKEFLPILFGKKLMNKFNLLPLKNGYFKNYNNDINPNIANAFATAAFRFAHSIIPSLMKLLANDTSTPEYIQMHKMLFNPFDLYQSGTLDKTLRGAMNTSIETNDPYFTNELKSHMFQRPESKLCGLDLVSLNIQRGRDHGLPAYVKWRKVCGFEEPKSFDDLEDVLDSDSLHNIRIIYKNVEDIDLYTGALSEKPIKNSILGPTITCLLLDQFYRIKHGDRFWYENPQKPQSFSPQQLNEIRKTTLAYIICDNSDGLDVIQRNVMEKVSSKNGQIKCSDLERPNLTLWKETLLRLDLNTDDLHILSVNSSN